MRVAVMVDGDLVSYHFDRAPAIVIVNCDEVRVVKAVQSPSSGQGGVRLTLDILKDEDVEAVRVGGIPRVLRHLSSAGIKVHSAPVMRVGKAVRDLIGRDRRDLRTLLKAQL